MHLFFFEIKIGLMLCYCDWYC